jgi:hypothetical protein
MRRRAFFFRQDEKAALGGDWAETLRAVSRCRDKTVSDATVERVREYRRYAAECVLLAEQIKEPAERGKVFAMARAWSRLAELAEKYRIEVALEKQ